MLEANEDVDALTEHPAVGGQCEVRHYRVEHPAPEDRQLWYINSKISTSLTASNSRWSTWSKSSSFRTPCTKKTSQYLAGSLFQTPPRTFSSLIECLTTLPPLLAREKDSFIAFFFFKGLCVPFTSSDIIWRQVPTFSKEFKVYNTITFWFESYVPKLFLPYSRNNSNT